MGVEVPKLEGQDLDLGTLSKVSELDSTKPADTPDVVLFSTSIGWGAYGFQGFEFRANRKSMKNYVERAMEMKKLKENVETLELEMKELEAKLTNARWILIWQETA
ncbi:hypothetical protein SESBI_37279 [Sesbania bispinosa]|nr:hypothetical protein SESBI_37279 [Sesbania bispinosa]